MKYTAIVEADGASIKQIETARAAYIGTLIQQQGGEEEVLKCWRAYARRVR
ncbi:hypothetical protein [Variovorax sp. JS1663]|uniref:hypothetical protein n=1 Tax=Variovorax sp. JS1663 TaxID=1851577 RepID=UPI001302BCD5|nr:hypothetical protein [Variovorax sp. JS1663]